MTCNIGTKMRRKAEKGGGGVGGKRGREVVSCLHLPPWQMNPFVSTRRVIRCVAGGQCAEGLNLTESDKKRGGGCKSRALHSLIRLSTHGSRPVVSQWRICAARNYPWRTDPRLNPLFLEHPWSSCRELGMFILWNRTRLNILILGIEGSKLVHRSQIVRIEVPSIRFYIRVDRCEQ